MYHDLDMMEKLSKGEKVKKKRVQEYQKLACTNSPLFPQVRAMGLYYPKSKESARVDQNDKGRLMLENGSDLPISGKYSLFYITN